LRKPTHVEGVSLRALLESPAISWNVPAVMTFKLKNHAVRMGPWRYIRYKDGSEEFSDRGGDPNEWANLAKRADMARRKTEMARFLPKVNALPKKKQ
jgi:hypothetical protein